MSSECANNVMKTEIDIHFKKRSAGASKKTHSLNMKKTNHLNLHREIKVFIPIIILYIYIYI